MKVSSAIDKVLTMLDDDSDVSEDSLSELEESDFAFFDFLAATSTVAIFLAATKTASSAFFFAKEFSCCKFIDSKNNQ